ncbi:MAG: hypothetical protein GY772_11725, partial [bacterium]|nr:hypothetical protein [bacterium]
VVLEDFGADRRFRCPVDEMVADADCRRRLDGGGGVSSGERETRGGSFRFLVRPADFCFTWYRLVCLRAPLGFVVDEFISLRMVSLQEIKMDVSLFDCCNRVVWFDREVGEKLREKKSC